MAENPNPDEDLSSHQRTVVVLRDWWLIKCSNEFKGKRFGVAGTQITETGAVRVFTSNPIIKAFDVFTLEASDGICIILRGFLNKQRLAQSGFLPQISSEFIFGFPPCWESKCNLCFRGLSSVNKASRTILSPCNDKRCNLEDGPAVVGKNTEETNDKDGRSGGSNARKKSLRLQSKPVVVTNDGNHGSDVEKDECEVINNQVDGCGKKHTVADKKHTVDGCGKKHTVADDVDEVASMSATEESQGKGGEFEARKACPRSLFEDLEKSAKPGKKAVSKTFRSGGDVAEHVDHSETKVKRKLDVSEVHKNPTTNDVGHGLNKAKGNECMDNEEISLVDGCGKMHSGTNSKKKTSTKNATKESLTSEQRKGKLKVTKTNGKSKKSEKILMDVVEPMTHPRSKVKGNLSVRKTIRKINFDEEVTPEKDGKKQKKINSVSADSLGQKRSRSGRVLVSPLEFWRNQVPVYDKARNLIQVNEGHQTNSTPSKGKGSSVSRKPRS